MKILATLAAATLLCVSAALPQTPVPVQHKVVLQMNVDGETSWNQVLGNARNIQTAFGEKNVRIEIVTYGKGILLMLKTNTAFEAQLKKAVESGIVIAVCQNSMRGRKVKSEDLFPFATEVDSGAAELVRKQEAGFAYLRAGE